MSTIVSSTKHAAEKDALGQEWKLRAMAHEALLLVISEARREASTRFSR